MTDTAVNPDTVGEEEGEVSEAESADNVELEAAVTLAVQALRNESVKFSDVVAAIAPKKAELAPAPEHLPLPAVITDDERKAIERLTEVYGSVVPTERRDLVPEEIVALHDERAVLKTVEGALKRRQDDLRATVFNALDVRAEESEEGVPEDTYIDDKGHYVLGGDIEVEGSGERFSREVRAGSPSVDPAILEALAEDPDFPDFTRKDYLAMTTQVRVFDENKAIIAMRKNPHMLKALRKATTRNRPTASLYVRKSKNK